MADGLHETLSEHAARVAFFVAEAIDRGIVAAEVEEPAAADTLSAAASGRIKSLVERLERLEADKAEVADELKGVYAEAKGEGFDTKTLRKIVRLRKQSKAERDEAEALLDLYLAAIGGL